MRDIFRTSWLFLFILTGMNGCKPDQVETDPFPAGMVYSIHIDPSGTAWAGSDAGLIRFNGTSWQVQTADGLSRGEIRQIAQNLTNPGDELWMATSNGATMATYDQDRVSSAMTYTREQDKLLDNDLGSVVIDSLNAKWFTTPLGLSILTGSSWLNENEYGDFIDYPLTSLGTTSDGWVFAGTNGLGVGRYKLKDGIDGVTGASFYDMAWSGLPTDTILAIHINSDNTQWYGTSQGAAYHNRWETKKGWTTYDISDGLIDNQVRCIAATTDGYTWMGTPEGASVFDGTVWINYTVADGLVNNEINDIAIDESGRIWFATSNGISMFDGTQWVNYNH